jgi:hypothetical protein
MVITDLAGLWAASLSAPDRGITDIGVAAVTTVVAATMGAVDTVGPAITVETDTVAALAMPGLVAAITTDLPATPVADMLSLVVRRVAITAVAWAAAVVTTVAAGSAAAADSTVAVVGSAEVTAVAGVVTAVVVDTGNLRFDGNGWLRPAVFYCELVVPPSRPPKN